MLRLMRMALEEAKNGKANKEIEHVLYARLEATKQLEKATHKEYQEQWELKVPHVEGNAGEGTVRIRMTQLPGKAPEYVLTTKVRAADGSRIEVAIPTTEDNFKQFQLLAATGMKKVRHFFPAVQMDFETGQSEKVVWEVDMFVRDVKLTADECLAGANYHDWCKIDLEVKNKKAALPLLPMIFEEVVGLGTRTPEQEAFIQGLYSSVFWTPNKFL